MVGTAPVNAPPVLCRVWHRWARVVASCAARTRVGLTSKGYARLYGELIEGLRLAAVSAAPAERDFYEELKELVQPWLTLAALTKTDSALLAQLLRRCQDAERRLQGREPAMRWDGIMSVGAVVTIAVLMVVAALTFSLDWWPQSLTERVHAQADRLWQAWQKLSGTYQLAIVAAAIAPFALVLLRRLVRR